MPLVKTVEENKMKLETVKVLSQNPTLRGKQFDVYYYEAFGSIELVSVEIPSDVKNLLPSLDEQSINDIRTSLKDMQTGRGIKELKQRISESEKSNGFAQDADANALKGLSND